MISPLRRRRADAAWIQWTIMCVLRPVFTTKNYNYRHNCAVQRVVSSPGEQRPVHVFSFQVGYTIANCVHIYCNRAVISSKDDKTHQEEKPKSKQTRIFLTIYCAFIRFDKKEGKDDEQ